MHGGERLEAARRVGQALLDRGLGAERPVTILSDNGIRMVRLDAVGYAIKKAGTSCFMIPETYDFIAELTTRARSRATLLVDPSALGRFRWLLLASPGLPSPPWRPLPSPGRHRHKPPWRRDAG